MQVHENFSLKHLNTFGIAGYARFYGSFRDEFELDQFVHDLHHLREVSKYPPMILGGGSNILVTGMIDRLVLRNQVKGIDIVKEDTNHVYVRTGAGESWHQFVLFCLHNNLAGVENLSLIPGSVGASPMQNIGAYGVEIKDVFEQLEAYDIAHAKIDTFSVNDCHFGYRESVFKKHLKDQYVILNVTFRLNKNPKFNVSYGAIEQELAAMGVTELNIKSISQAVINIRSSKLPDPKVIGNAGSFFKNPTVPQEVYGKLLIEYPEIVGYPAPNGGVKLAGGWLIEQAGWKGFRRGDAGCHAKQALVLVNYGNATGREIYELSSEILLSVFEKFGVRLEREVNVV